MGGVGVLGSLFLAGFFTLHYGMFCFVHGIFVVTLTSGGGFSGVGGGSEAELGRVFLEWPREGWLALGSMFVMRGLGVWQDFIATGKWKTAEPGKLMGEPYGHIVVVHVAIIAGAGLAMALGGAWPLFVFIVLGKFGLDLVFLARKGGVRSQKGGKD
ncbi:MAG: DUF6498-containing protein [Verrucomicrobiota bacterium]